MVPDKLELSNMAEDRRPFSIRNITVAFHIHDVLRPLKSRI